MKRQNDREAYSHKFTMKEEALKIALNLKEDEPRFIQDHSEFGQALKETLLKDIMQVMSHNATSRFTRKTRMGGHLSLTLKKAGLAKMGFISGQEQPQYLTAQADNSIMVNNSS